MKKNEFEKIRITIFADNTENAIEMLEKKVAELKAQKEKEKWVFTEDEKVILRNLAEEYEYIARDENNDLYIFVTPPVKGSCTWGTLGGSGILIFSHLFQCIKWTDTEPCEFRKYI